jgi:hypothetical protein
MFASFVVLLSLLIANCGVAAEKLDPALATQQEGEDVLWYDIELLGIEGRGCGQRRGIPLR